MFRFLLFFCFQRFLFKEILSNKLMHYKCWFWNRVPNIKEAISQSNIDQFSKLRTFLKSKFCGLLKNDQNIYPSCFGGREIAKKQSVQSISGHHVRSANWTLFVTGPLKLARWTFWPWNDILAISSIFRSCDHFF